MEKHELKTEQNSKKRQRNFQLMGTGTKKGMLLLVKISIASWNS